MPKHLIIDGYNLLGSRGQMTSTSDKAREQLIHELMLYRQRRGHHITVVFDGWKHGLNSEHVEHRAGIEVMYSKRGQQADHVIGRLAEHFAESCGVVSSDREVQRHAKTHGAFVITVAEFESRLRERSITTQTAAYRDKDRDDDGEIRKSTEKKGNAKKLPKALRRRNRQLRGF